MIDDIKTNLRAVGKEWKLWYWRLKDAREEWWSEFKAEEKLLRKIFHKGISNFFTEFYRALGIQVPRTCMYLTVLFGIWTVYNGL